MKFQTLLTIVVSSLLFASFALASSDALSPTQIKLDSKTIRAVTNVVIEAESADLTGPMMVMPDGQAYGNECIKGFKVNRRGWASYTFTIPREGDYIIWGRIKGRDGFANSFFATIDGGAELVWDVKKNNKWEWDVLSDRGAGSTNYPETDPVMFHFAAGEHTLVIGNREKESLLDRILITDDIERLYYPHPDSWIQLDAPGMAEIIAPGSMYEFKWSSQAVTGPINIDLSLDRGKSFTVSVVQGTENDGSYVWQAPSYFNLAKVVARVTDAASGLYDINDGYFALMNPQNIFLTLRNPVAGDTLHPGEVCVIKWIERGFNGLVDIYLMQDVGFPWKKFADKKNASGEYQWLVPDVVTENCRIKVADAADGDPVAESGVFSILPAGAGQAGSTRGLSLASLPTQLELVQNYPNPFNPQTTIHFGLPQDAHVLLQLFDALGRNVATLIDAEMEAGWHTVDWNGKDFPSGIYTAVLQSRSQRLIRQMSLIK